MKILGEHSFQLWISRHLSRHFPDFAAAFSTPDLHNWIEDHLKTAAGYFRTEPGKTLYIDLTILLGEGFAANPKLPWAREILSDSALDEVERRRRLYTKARAHLLGPPRLGRFRRA